ncbi:MAG TPA: hypothetical protein DCK93_13620 [Blastocatellia bacterium]|nr:hypothetical protein [Blastocatellia bacterium]
MAADRLGEELLSLLVAVDHVLGIDRVRVDERVDVGDHCMAAAYQEVCDLHTSWYVTGRRSDGGTHWGLRSTRPITSEAASL